MIFGTYLLAGILLLIPLYYLGIEDRKNYSITMWQTVKTFIFFIAVWIMILVVDWQYAVFSLVLGLTCIYLLRRPMKLLLAQADFEIVGLLLAVIFPIGVITMLFYLGISIYHAKRKVRRHFPALWRLFQAYVVALIVFAFLTGYIL